MMVLSLMVMVVIVLRVTLTLLTELTPFCKETDVRQGNKHNYMLVGSGAVCLCGGWGECIHIFVIVFSFTED